MSNKTIRVVELFAGVGGFRVGFERCSSRFETVWANQWEPGQAGQWAYKCYAKNFGEKANINNKDIATVIDQVPEHDLLVGGFPCQDYSVAHSGAQGIEGQKGVLWWSIHDIIKLRHPSFILLENVDRLLKSPSKQRGRDFGVILRCLSEEGYAAEWRVINAAEYGHAQRRRRTFIFAYRNDTKVYKELEASSMPEWIKSQGLLANAFPVLDTVDEKKRSNADLNAYDDLVVLSKQFKCAFYSAGVMLNGKVFSEEVKPVEIAPTLLKDIVHHHHVDEKYFISEEDMPKWESLKGAKKIERTAKATGYAYTFSEGPVAFPDPLNRPGRTMLTSESSINRSTHVVQDVLTGRLRKLTPVECERLNGFPDDWTNTEMPERQRYFIMGNALVTPLITSMGRELLERLR